MLKMLGCVCVCPPFLLHCKGQRCWDQPALPWCLLKDTQNSAPTAHLLFQRTPLFPQATRDGNQRNGKIITV